MLATDNWDISNVFFYRGSPRPRHAAAGDQGATRAAEEAAGPAGETPGGH